MLKPPPQKKIAGVPVVYLVLTRRITNGVVKTYTYGYRYEKKRMEFLVFVDNIIYYIDLNNEN